MFFRQQTARFALAIGLLAGLGVLAEAQETEVDSATKARYDAFSKALSGSKFVGNFTIVGQELGKLTPEEYSIKSVKKMPEGDMWLFVARIKYGERDMSVPIPLEVRWAGDDTPVICVTDFSIFGYGPFSARVVVYNDKYSGTWSHGEVHGHLFGVIKPGEAEEVDVKKFERKMRGKQKNSTEEKKSK